MKQEEKIFYTIIAILIIVWIGIVYFMSKALIL